MWGAAHFSYLSLGITLVACARSVDDTNTRGGDTIYIIRAIDPDPTGCLPRPLHVEVDGSVSCTVASATPSENCDCTVQHLSIASLGLTNSVRTFLERQGTCGTPDTPACTSFCICELAQATGADLNRCRDSETGASGPYAFCYADSALDSPAYSASTNCTDGTIRFLGFTPVEGNQPLLACPGSF